MNGIENREVTLTRDGEAFRFRLVRKPGAHLGPAELDQWWMPITPLYGQRSKGQPGHNHREILRYHWFVTRRVQAGSLREAQERLTMAALVPHVRCQGSRTIFADAFLRQPNHKATFARVSALQNKLTSDGDQRCTRVEFFEKSWGLLGCPEFPDGCREAYTQLASELLDEPCRLLGENQVDRACAAVVANWKRLNRRRHFTDVQRAVLDALSYEAKAAFHDAYSVAWDALILELSGDGDARFRNFHKFWHTSLRDSEFGTPLFHGHVLGLHPALGEFVLTPKGQQLLGSWLMNPRSLESHEHLLRGCLVALHHYDETREVERNTRPRKRESKYSAGAKAAIQTHLRNQPTSPGSQS